MKKHFNTVLFVRRVICFVFLLLVTGMCYAESEMGKRWIKLLYMDLSLYIPFSIETRFLEIAVSPKTNSKFGIGTALGEGLCFYSIAPVDLGLHLSFFPISLYYIPTVRWAEVDKPLLATLLCFTYGRVWFPEDEVSQIENRNCLSFSCSFIRQRIIAAGIKVWAVYTFSDDMRTMHFTAGAGFTVWLGRLMRFGGKTSE